MRNASYRLSIIFVLVLLLSSLLAYGSCNHQVPLSIQVTPEEIHGESIAGQTCVFLVIVNENRPSAPGTEPVIISAAATGAETIVVNPSLVDGDVAEVHVVPDESSAGDTVTVEIAIEQGEYTDVETVSFSVVDGEDLRKNRAEKIRDTFVSWIVENHPELGIGNDTEWAGTIVSPKWLVVEHYLFFSDQWEMHLSWHVMIPPSDWARINLRQRFSEDKPSLAFEISSLDSGSDPVAVDPEESIWR